MLRPAPAVMAAIAASFLPQRSIGCATSNARPSCAPGHPQTMGDLQPSERQPIGGGDQHPRPESELELRFNRQVARGKGAPEG